MELSLVQPYNYDASISLRHRTSAPLHYFFSLPLASVIYKALDGVHWRQSLFKVFSYKRKSLRLEPPQDSLLSHWVKRRGWTFGGSSALFFYITSFYILTKQSRVIIFPLTSSRADKLALSGARLLKIECGQCGIFCISVQRPQRRFVNQWMIFSNFHCRGTLNQKPTIESIFLLCKLSGRSMAVKWVAMMEKKKWKRKPDFKKLIIVCGRRQLDQQATTQTALKLRVVYKANTKVLCLWYEGWFFSWVWDFAMRIWRYDVIFLKIAKP